MSVVISMNTSGWSVIIFWFFVMILVGSLGLYLGPKCRKIIKSEKSTNIKYYDFVVIVLMVYFVAEDVTFWFLEGHYDYNILETAFISASIYGDIGLSMIYYPLLVGSNRLVKHLRKIWRVRKDDVD